MNSPAQAFNIFIVDDDATARMVAAAALDAPEYAVREFSDAPALLAALQDFDTITPDLILLDIEMPGMDGIEACRALRAAGNQATQVMFVSARNDLQTRLTAYDAGGNDFIVKPYELDELARKAAVARQYAARQLELGAQAQFAQQTAFTAMSSMAEMGVVLAFLRDSFACDTPAALAAKLFDALRQFGLDGLARLTSAGAWQHFASHGECTPIECGILDHAATLERIFQFRNRLTVNYANITLIAHPLPLDDPDRVGRLRDHIAILAEGAAVRLQAMETMRRQQAQAGGIGEAVTELTATIEEIDRQQAAHRLRAAEIDEAFLEELIAAFVHLGLTEDQEKTLADMAQRTHGQLTELRDAAGESSDRLREVTHKLNRLVNK
jgi:CheY-like chemotaxis protein